MYLYNKIMETKELNTKHEKDILEIIPKHPIFSFVDIFQFYKGCTRSTAYNHGLDKLDSIKEAIYSNKRRGVTTLLSKWIASDNATLSMGAMKILCDPEEHKKLQQNYTDISTKGDKIQLSETEAISRIKELESLLSDDQR